MTPQNEGSPPNLHLCQLRIQAKDLRKAHDVGAMSAMQRIKKFHHRNVF